MEESPLKPYSVTSAPWYQFFRANWLYIVLAIFVTNAVLLDIFVLFSRTNPSNQQASVLQNIASSFPAISQTSSCPQSCVAMIQANPQSPVGAPTGAVLPTATPTPAPTATPIPTPTPTQHEYFVPLGTGSSNAADWTTVSGIGATVDPTKYGSFQKVTFEVTVWVPTGNETVWVRLYNANTFQSIAGSEVQVSGGTSTLLVSSPINLQSGVGNYQVQVKTQLQYPAYIQMARIHIITD